jgi:L-ribulose-5-phosphate 3-epimerase
VKLAAFSGVFIDYSIQEAMRMTKRLELDGLEIAVREPHLTASTSSPRIREIKALAEDLGLELPVLAGYMGSFSTASDTEAQGEFDEFQRLLNHANELGSSMIRVFAGGPNAFLAEDYHYAKAAHWLNRCAVEAKKANIRILLEIHNDSLTETVDSSLRLLGMLEHDNVGVIHDAGNMYITDTDYGRDSVLQLGPSLFHVHVKDERRIEAAGSPGSFVSLTRHGKEAFQQSRMGEGKADHLPLFSALKETGYTGWITLECHAPFPPYERIEHDLRFVRELWNQVSSK